MLKLVKNEKKYKKFYFIIGDKFAIHRNIISIDKKLIHQPEVLYFELCQLVKTIHEPIEIDFNEIQYLNSDIILRAFNYAFYTMNDFKTTNKVLDIEVNLKNIDLKEFDTYQIKFEAMNNARYLDDLPPNIATPDFIAKFIKKRIDDNLSIKILNKAEIEKEKLGLVSAVSQGSKNEPRFVILEYLPDRYKSIEAVLVGKGITMDTGGYSLKNSSGQQGMHLDMCGASLVLNSLIALAKLKVNKNLVAIAPLTENCIGNGSTLVNSIVPSYSGKTIEITNTDAEGRLVLADAISYAVKNYQPRMILDYATLTGSVAKALGIQLTGAFTNDKNLYFKFSHFANSLGEPIWELPIQKLNSDNMKESTFADLKNASTNSDFGVGNAAAFLQMFVENTSWLHLDIAGTAEYQHKSTGVLIDSTIEYFKGDDN